MQMFDILMYKYKCLIYIYIYSIYNYIFDTNVVEKYKGDVHDLFVFIGCDKSHVKGDS